MIIATAGHVDHGKTALVRALTGTDPDRLPEEKLRGMTIDLGFAYMPVSGKKAIGFVDVPGHERFIHNMIAGVSGIDHVLIVVSADDGPMPQTREHIQILQLIGVRQASVALTKIDRVAADRVLEVGDEITAMLADTVFSGVSVFPVSVRSGVGIERLIDHLKELPSAGRCRKADGRFRLAVDRVFALRGVGLVVTGTVMSGSVRCGDAVRVLRGRQAARIRSIHAQNVQSAMAMAGDRCALNLAGISGKEAVVRGDWVVEEHVPGPILRAAVKLRMLKNAGRSCSTNAHVQIYVGAAHTMCRVVPLRRHSECPEDERFADVLLISPIGAVRGDPFILRDPSSHRTIGGGTVLDVFPALRRRAAPERVQRLIAMEKDEDRESLEALLQGSPNGVSLPEFEGNRNLAMTGAEQLYATVAMRRARTYGFASAHWSCLGKKIVAQVAEWHARFPDRLGPAHNQLLVGSATRIPETARADLVDELVGNGTLVREGPILRLPAHRPSLSPADQALWGNCQGWLNEHSLRPPTVSELASYAGESPASMEAALCRLERHRLIVRISKTRFFLPCAVEHLKTIAAEHARVANGITAASFRDRSHVGRNTAVEVLEYFDRIQFTRRIGDAHFITKKGQ